MTDQPRRWRKTPTAEMPPSRSHVRLSRDIEHDVVYVLVDGLSPQTVTNLPLSSEITIRFRKHERDVVGFTIDEFSTLFPAWTRWTDAQVRTAFEYILAVVNDSDTRCLAQAAIRVVTTLGGERTADDADRDSASRPLEEQDV